LSFRRRRLNGGSFGFRTSVPLWFRCHTLLLLVKPQTVRLQPFRYW
jgi:hypothetical protein